MFAWVIARIIRAHYLPGYALMRLLPALLLLVLALPCAASLRAEGDAGKAADVQPVALSADDFRDQVVAYVRAQTGHRLLGSAAPDAAALDARWSRPFREKQWRLRVSAYRQGELRGAGTATATTLAEALDRASAAASADLIGAPDAAAQLAATRFLVVFDYLPDRRFAMVEADGHGREWIGDRVILRRFDAAALAAQITAGKRYLLRMQDARWHAWFRHYDAPTDRSDQRLRTIYTASALLTLFRLHEQQPDPEIARIIAPTLAFLHSMQLPDGAQAGALRYSINTATGDKGCRLMVGTASKTIFTLLHLYQTRGGRAELRAAERAGDWLLGRVEADGRVQPKLVCTANGGWRVSGRQSFLYSGQVLSALSRLYAVTRAPRYYAAAGRIAGRMRAELDRQQGFVGDDYRAPNSISTSWVAMALDDYAAVDPQPGYARAIDRAMAAVQWRQIRDPRDAFDHGRFLDTMSSSGNGWINEVLGQLRASCRERGQSDCDRYLGAMLASGRWLVQNSYTPANSLKLPNPARAEGGAIGSIRAGTVRTDAVCHALNGLLALARAKADDPGVWLDLPERRFDETLILLREIPRAGGAVGPAADSADAGSG